ncbi:unnamed protein product [Angiostrongylus costaricensis]|uniref:SAC domain-containing protein n=1 Tax=Angiostrongylus costaricensis TaxID=334426 RepID=A0A0R3PIE4_ANGCS|nr:unnamed protein product [Angiostrongylus costaricensis]
MNIDSFEQLTTRIGYLRLKRSGFLTIFVVYAPTSNYDEEEDDAFYMDLEKFYTEDHIFFKKTHPQRWTWQSPNGEYLNEIDHIMVNRRLSLTGLAVVPKFYMGSDYRLFRANFYFSWKGAAKFKKRSARTTINWYLFNSSAGCWEDAVLDNIDEEYDRLI